MPPPAAPFDKSTASAGVQSKFVHLHLHSEYSLLDGGNQLGNLLDYCHANGMDALAVTDHGNLFAAVEFYTRATEYTAKDPADKSKKIKAPIKPILGIEAYVARDEEGLPVARTVRRDPKARTATKVDTGGHHLVLLCENNQGWKNLLKLSSDAFLKGFYGNPRADLETLEKWNEGLIAINGHLGSSVAYFLTRFVEKKDAKFLELAKAEARWHKKIFGPNDKGEPRFYLELQRYDESHEEGPRAKQSDINPLIVEMARELGIPLVCDNDAHFLTAEDWDAHDTLCRISMGKLKSEKGLTYPKDLYVKTPAQMAEAFKDLPEALENTVKIADRCNVKLDLKSTYAPVVNPEFGPRIKAILEKTGTAGEQMAQFQSAFAPGSNEWLKDFCDELIIHPVKDGSIDPSTGQPFDNAKLKDQCDLALRLLSEAGLLWRYGAAGITEPIRARLERELKILADKKISAYFIIVWDFVNFGRSNGIPCTARGSGVGTMTGFVLGLSNGCPVKYGLLFERFTDPEREAYPDIDIDMCQTGRPRLIQWVRDKYGFVAQIITFNVMKAKMAMKDVGRVMDMPLGEVNAVCKLIGDDLDVTLDSALNGKKGKDGTFEKHPNEELRRIYDEQPLARKTYDAARKLEGMVRNPGVHAAGVIVATQPLDNICPLYLPTKKNQDESMGDQTVTQWEGPICEKVGLLKMDFLGLQTISVIERAKELIRKDFTPAQIRAQVAPAPGSKQLENADPACDPLDLDRLAGDDPRVLALYQRGETDGVFQFESGGMKGLLMGMKPDRLEDLIAANALYRPGPMEYIPQYNARKHGREPVPQVHPAADRITGETYGIMIYQEQIMQVLNEVGGIKLRAAYDVIKAISKKVVEKIDKAKGDFLIGAEKNGIGKEAADKIFADILMFAGYGFNKSHSTGYSIVSYQTAYLKTHFPLQFMAAVLTFESGAIEKVAEKLESCKRLRLPDGTRGAEVRPPDVNQSEIAFTVVFDKGEKKTPSTGHIRFGMSAVKGVGEKAVETILAARRKDGPFRSIFDLAERVDLSKVNKSVLESLVKCGAFDSIHGGAASRASLLAAVEPAIARGAQESALQNSDSFLFGAVAASAKAGKKDEPSLPEVEPWGTRDGLEKEKEVLGLYVSSHPMAEHFPALKSFASAQIEDMVDLPDGTAVILGGMLSALRVITTQKGAKMAFATLEGTGRKCDGVVFPRTFEECEPLLKVDSVVFFRGKVDKKKGDPSILVDEVIPIANAPAKLCQGLRIVVEDAPGADLGLAGKEQFKSLKTRLRNSDRGTVEVLLEVRQDGIAANLRLPNRVRADWSLARAIESILGTSPGRTCRCELLGGPKVVRKKAVAESGDAPVELMGFSSAKQGVGAACASLERF